jgi:hypothetical protein
LYQEYAGRDLAKPVLYQDLLYDLQTPVIRFFDLGIRVLEVTSEGIRYVITRPPPEVYRGPDMPDSRVATLDGASEIDGMTTDVRTQTRLLPGPHTIRYVVTFGGSVLRGPAVRTVQGRAVLVMKAGHAYTVKGERTGDWANPGLYVWIEDTTEGQIVHGARP